MSEELNLDALRGAYVSLKNIAREHRSSADAHRHEADRCELRARDYDDMAEAASRAYVEQGGDPALAKNWYSWTYLGTAEKSRLAPPPANEETTRD